MTSESNRISAASIAYVDAVCRAWGWSWSEMGQADDDGLDGLVYLRVKKVNKGKPHDRRSWKHQFTGGLIHVQVKSGASYVAYEAHDRIDVRIRNLDAKRKLWEKSPLPLALIYVKEEESLGRSPSKAWWADLKDSASYRGGGTVTLLRKHRFQGGLECRRPFERLASGQHRHLGLEEIDMSTPWSLPGRLNSLSRGSKFAAWDFYHRWKTTGAVNPDLGEVTVNRTGWSHITRVGRPVSRIQTSFELLPAAARIVATSKNWQLLRRGSIRTLANGSWAAYEYLGLSAFVKWPARAPSEVMVILKRQTILTEDVTSTNAIKTPRVLSRRTWFYSVYEPGRAKGKN